MEGLCEHKLQERPRAPRVDRGTARATRATRATGGQAETRGARTRPSLRTRRGEDARGRGPATGGLMRCPGLITCPLVPGVPHLVSGSCASPRAFGLGFLQTPPRGDALALLLAFGSAITWREDFHLARSVPYLAHVRLQARAARGAPLCKPLFGGTRS